MRRPVTCADTDLGNDRDDYDDDYGDSSCAERAKREQAVENVTCATTYCFAVSCE